MSHESATISQAKAVSEALKDNRMSPRPAVSDGDAGIAGALGAVSVDKHLPYDPVGVTHAGHGARGRYTGNAAIRCGCATAIDVADC